MATANITHPTFNNGSDTNFRLWGKWVSDSLAAVGLVKTADTGQIDWTTVLTPSALNQSRGVEVWRFADALQATTPVYVLLEYGSASSSAQIPGMWITFGTGSTGTGALTGLQTTRVQIVSNSSVATPINHFVSGSTGRFVIALGMGGPGASLSSPLFIAAERAKDNTGNDIAGGVYALYRSANSTARQRYHQPGIGDSGEESGWSIFMPNQGTGVSGADVCVYPCFLQRGVYLPPCLSIVGVFLGSVTVDTTIVVPMYGVNRTYYVTSQGPNVSRATTTNASRLAFLFE